VAIMQKIARHISHKANDDFLHSDKALVEELCYAMKQDSLQIRREGNNDNVIF
jgi:hypothetical protein